MIFYFSGTGNSQHVATEIAAFINERCINIADAIAAGEYEYTLHAGERIGFVSPVHAWGPSPFMVEFVKKLILYNVSASMSYCYFVPVCGDDIGLTVDMLEAVLPAGLHFNAAFSVQMPNNYILLPGFDTDSKTLELSKLAAAQSRIATVATAVVERRGGVDVVRGSVPALKSRVVYPLFRKYYMSDKRFCADDNLCSRCGACARRCPVANITMNSDGLPQWNGNCQMCLACIHYCPKRAIDFGKITKKKGRYHYHK